MKKERYRTHKKLLLSVKPIFIPIFTEIAA